MAERYKPFYKGDGWLGCRGLDVAEAVTFFYLRKNRDAIKPIQPRFPPSKPPAVSRVTLLRMGFNGNNGNYQKRRAADTVARLDHDNELRAQGDAALLMDQRCLFVRPPYSKPPLPPEAWVLTIHGCYPGACAPSSSVLLSAGVDLHCPSNYLTPPS